MWDGTYLESARVITGRCMITPSEALCDLCADKNLNKTYVLRRLCVVCGNYNSCQLVKNFGQVISAMTPAYRRTNNEADKTKYTKNRQL